MKLNEEIFLTCFIASALGRQSHSIALAEDVDPHVMGKAINEASRNAELYWATLSDKDVKSTPSNKKNSKITDAQWNFLTIAQFRDDKLNQKEFGFVTDRFKCGKNQKITEIQSNWIDRLIKKIGD